MCEWRQMTTREEWLYLIKMKSIGVFDKYDKHRLEVIRGDEAVRRWQAIGPNARMGRALNEIWQEFTRLLTPVVKWLAVRLNRYG